MRLHLILPFAILCFPELCQAADASLCGLSYGEISVTLARSNPSSTRRDLYASLGACGDDVSLAILKAKILEKPFSEDKLWAIEGLTIWAGNGTRTIKDEALSSMILGLTEEKHAIEPIVALLSSGALHPDASAWQPLAQKLNLPGFESLITVVPLSLLEGIDLGNDKQRYYFFARLFSEPTPIGPNLAAALSKRDRSQFSAFELVALLSYMARIKSSDPGELAFALHCALNHPSSWVKESAWAAWLALAPGNLQESSTTLLRLARSTHDGAVKSAAILTLARHGADEVQAELEVTALSDVDRLRCIKAWLQRGAGRGIPVKVLANLAASGSDQEAWCALLLLKGQKEFDGAVVQAYRRFRQSEYAGLRLKLLDLMAEVGASSFVNFYYQAAVDPNPSVQRRGIFLYKQNKGPLPVPAPRPSGESFAVSEREIKDAQQAVVTLQFTHGSVSMRFTDKFPSLAAQLYRDASAWSKGEIERSTISNVTLHVAGSMDHENTEVIREPRFVKRGTVALVESADYMSGTVLRFYAEDTLESNRVIPVGELISGQANMQRWENGDHLENVTFEGIVSLERI